MNLVADAARVASGVCVVAAECSKRLVGSFAFDALKSFTRRDARERSEAVKGAMDLGRKSSTEGVVPQPEELFAPSKAAESKEARPFKDVEEPLAPKVALPSVDANLPTK